MCFSIFSGSTFLSIIVKCWDLENFRKTFQMEWNYSTIISFCIQYCILKISLSWYSFLCLTNCYFYQSYFCREDLLSLNQIYSYTSSESDYFLINKGIVNLLLYKVSFWYSWAFYTSNTVHITTVRPDIKICWFAITLVCFC